MLLTLPTPSRILVALSGGADSVALLLMLQEEGHHLAAAHCNFHLRGDESDRDEAFCRRLCQRHHIPLHVAHFDTTAEAAANGESIEMAARRLRYAWFDTLCETEGYDVVAVAHHRNDNVETLLLNLVRGTGIHGLTGMRHRRDRIVRPLLDMDRRDILHFLEERGQDFVEDSTNSDTHYKRNFVRHELLPRLRQLNPSFDATAATMMRRLAAVEDIYRRGVDALLGELLQPAPHGYRLDLAAAEYRGVFDAIGERFGLTNDMVEHLVQWSTVSERAVFEGDNWLAVVRRGILHLTQRPPHIGVTILPATGTISLPDGGRLVISRLPRTALTVIPRERCRVALDADTIVGNLTYRAPAAEERFAPFGLRGSKGVADYLADRHQSAPQRLWARVVADDDGILWLAGERPDRRGAITAATQQVVLLDYTPAD